MSEQKVSEALRKAGDLLGRFLLEPDKEAYQDAAVFLRNIDTELINIAIQLEQDHARLVAQIEAMTEPGKASGIVRAVFELAERECEHQGHSAKHGLTSIREWIAKSKQENARLTAQVAELQAKLAEWVAIGAETPHGMRVMIDCSMDSYSRLKSQRDELQKQLDARTVERNALHETVAKLILGESK